MEYRDIINSKAKDLDQGLVVEIINRAYDKCHKIMLESLALEDDAEYTFEMNQDLLFSKMFEHLINMSEIIGDLSESITIGAFEHLVEVTGLTEEEILEMDEDDMEEIIKPYLVLQHKYADFNNNEVKEMLFETAKHLLSPIELMRIYLGY